MDYFVYGTLADPGRASAVLDEYEFGPDAVLSGLHLVYVGDPDRLGVAESVNWPGNGPLAARIRRYVGENGVEILAV